MDCEFDRNSSRDGVHARVGEHETESCSDCGVSTQPHHGVLGARHVMDSRLAVRGLLAIFINQATQGALRRAQQSR